MSTHSPLRVGIGGPVGVGKTTLTEHLCRALAHRCSMAIITNDIYTREDAEYLMRAHVLPVDRIRGWRPGAVRTRRSARTHRSTWPRLLISTTIFRGLT